MSATTTLRLPEELKGRVTELAQQAGKSPHTFMLEAIAEKAASEEAVRDFHAQADKRLNELVSTGQAIPWNEMRAYLRKRAQGDRAAAPRPGKLRG